MVITNWKMVQKYLLKTEKLLQSNHLLKKNLMKLVKLLLKKLKNLLLNKELNTAVADARIRARIVELGGTPLGGTPAEFATIISEATDKWAKVIKFAGVKAE